MAPIKFENDFKEKLNNRTIAPSKDAWDKLSKQLDAESTSKNNTYWWVGIAASVIGVLCLAFHFFDTKVTPTNQDIVINPQVKDTVTAQQRNVPKLDEAIAGKPQILSNGNATQHTKDKTSVIITDAVNLNAHFDSQDNNKVVAIANTATDVKMQQSTTAIAFEDIKAQEIAEVIYNLSESENGISEFTIDSLLKTAQRAIRLEKLQQDGNMVVNATLLLQEVEEDLDKSFREKVIYTLKQSYGSVKTAIAQRNE